MGPKKLLPEVEVGTVCLGHNTENRAHVVWGSKLKLASSRSNILNFVRIPFASYRVLIGLFALPGTVITGGRGSE